MRSTSNAKLVRMVQDLKARRERLVNELAEIDAIFQQFGSAGRAVAMAPATVAAPAKPGKRGRRRFAISAEQFVLDMLADGKEHSSRDINKAWREKYGGLTADTALSRLSKAGKLKRTKLPNGPGSSYRLA